jgi:hypothetical protein
MNNFKKYLRAKGAEILEPTNPYELVRFRANGAIHVIYEGKRGISFVGESEKAYNAFQNKGIWSVDIKKDKRRNLSVIKRTLIERDGDKCFYCKNPLEDDITVEHLLSMCHGGPNHISNYVLSHKDCNSKVGHLSIMDKIKIREKS